MKEINVKIRAGSIFNSKNSHYNDSYRLLIALLDGHDVVARIYSKTNMVFHFDPKNIQSLVENYSGEYGYKINKCTIDKLVQFTNGTVYYHLNPMNIDSESYNKIVEVIG